MIADRRLRHVATVEAGELYAYRPTLLRPYYTGWSGWAEDHTAHTASHRARMALELLEAGYRVYYLAVQNELVSYVTVARGGGRLRSAGKNDIVLGPVFTPARFRGRGYAAAAETAVLHSLGLAYDAAYEYIKKDNAPSLRVAEKCGFVPVCEGAIRGRLRRVYPVKTGGSHIIVKYSHSE